MYLNNWHIWQNVVNTGVLHILPSWEDEKEFYNPGGLKSREGF